MFINFLVTQREKLKITLRVHPGICERLSKGRLTKVIGLMRTLRKNSWRCDVALRLFPSRPTQTPGPLVQVRLDWSDPKLAYWLLVSPSYSSAYFFYYIEYTYINERWSISVWPNKEILRISIQNSGVVIKKKINTNLHLLIPHFKAFW